MVPEQYLDCQGILNWLCDKTQSPQLRYTQTLLPNRMSLVDISLNPNGSNEDQEFLEKPFVLNNIRRGSSLLITLNKNYPLQDAEFNHYLDQKTNFFSDSETKSEEKEEKETKNFLKDEKKPKNKSKKNDQDIKPGEKEKLSENKIKEKIPKFSISDIQNAEWIRRGLKKFFDLSLDHLHSTGTPGLEKNYPKKNSKLKDQIPITRKIIFNQIENSIADGHSIEVYQTEKANGENAQVGYSSKLGKWIISSKNCSIVVEDEREIEKYNHERYSYAKVMAKAWFRYLSTCGNINLLKSELEFRTMIGEYIGQIEFIHIVKYTETKIKFYAIVDNNSAYSCIPTLEAFNFFTKYGIDHVSIEKIGSFTKISDLHTALYNLYIKISEQDLNEGGEGSVLYFTENRYKNYSRIETLENNIFSKRLENHNFDDVFEVTAAQKTLVLCKVKTLEYRINRKIRENVSKLKSKENAAFLINKFTTEFDELTTGFNLPKPKQDFLNFYHEILQEKLKQLEQGTKSSNLNYLLHGIKQETQERKKKFIQVIIEANCCLSINCKKIATELDYKLVDLRKNQAKPNTLCHDEFNLDFLFRLKEKVLLVCVGYDENTIQRSINSKNFHDPKECPRILTRYFIGSGKKHPNPYEKVLEYFQAKKKTIDKLQQCSNIYFIETSQTEEKHLADIISNKIQEIGEIENTGELEEHIEGEKSFLVIPIGFPGIGKTYLTNILKEFCKEKSLDFKEISSDKIRKKCIANYLNENPTVSYDENQSEVFKKTSKVAKAYFESNLTNYLNAKKTYLIYCDKNFPPNGLKHLLLLASNSNKNKKIVTIGLVPECKKYVVSAKKEFDFSYNLLITALHRILKREKHETMSGPDSYKIGIAIGIFHSFRNFELESAPVDYLIKLPFSNEEKELGDASLKYRINSVLDELETDYDAHFKNFEDIAAIIKDIDIPYENYKDKLLGQISEIISNYKTFNIKSVPQIEEDQSNPDEKVKPEQFKSAEDNKHEIFEEKKNEQSQPIKEIPYEESKLLGHRQSIPNKNFIPNQSKKNYRKVLYLGINVENSLRHILFDLVLNALEQFESIFSTQEIREDIESINQLKSNQFSGWKIPEQLHLTTKFFGNKAKESDLKDFNEGRSVGLLIDYLAYSPGKIICLKASLDTPDINVENKHPHITLLTCKERPKYSSDLLAAMNFKPGISKYSINAASAYTYQYYNDLIIEGRTKKYYN